MWCRAIEGTDVGMTEASVQAAQTKGVWYLTSCVPGGIPRWYLFDGLGSVTELVDSNENTQNSYRHEAFGQLESSSENVTDPCKYVGTFGVRHYSTPALYFMQATRYKALRPLLKVIIRMLWPGRSLLTPGKVVDGRT